MKKVLFLICFVFTTICLNAQELTSKKYGFMEKKTDIILYDGNGDLVLQIGYKFKRDKQQKRAVKSLTIEGQVYQLIKKNQRVLIENDEGVIIARIGKYGNLYLVDTQKEYKRKFKSFKQRVVYLDDQKQEIINSDYSKNTYILQSYEKREKPNYLLMALCLNELLEKQQQDISGTSDFLLLLSNCD